MGYSEIMCQLCGVSSNIARIRTKDESPLDSWYVGGYENRPIRQSYIGNEDCDIEECTDCLFTEAPSFPVDEAEPGWVTGKKQRGTADWPEENFQPFTENQPEESMFGGGNEHIAGPNCGCTAGYNGHNISADEMRLCGTVQCLLPKQPDWQPESGDEEFEIDAGGQYFLSGLRDFMGSRDDGPSRFEPERHGTSLEAPDNFAVDGESAADLAMLFHPCCFEVYKRACLARTGRVDVRALTDWFRLEADYDMFFQTFPRHKAVREAEEQWWSHNKGDEWLAANPLFVPKLKKVIRESTNGSEAKPTDERSSNAVGIDESLIHQDRAGSPDNFERMSLELRLEILSHLDGHDIANLRLVSRAFRVLPQSVFRRLVLEEHPWLWEAWCDRPYPMWAATTSWELKRQRKIARPDRAPDQSDEEFDAERKRCQARFHDYRQARPADTLPAQSTDWLRIYTALNRDLNNILGLRNRKRIWKDCNYILDRIKLHTRKGRRGNGINVDPVSRHGAWENDELSDSDRGVTDE